MSVVGIGPGALFYLTAGARQALAECDLVVGYQLYLEQVSELVSGKEILASGMGGEVERCRRAAAAAATGRRVALVSGGDPGVYGMAGLLLQVAAEMDPPPRVEVIPGVTAAAAASALLGAPLMHDFATISLSDLLTPLEKIWERLRAAVAADFVIVLYNPRSRGRPALLAEARRLILEQRAPGTPVGMIRHAGREEQEIWRTSLTELKSYLEKADMATLLIIGSSETYWQGEWMITPRGYRL